ncbi:hypothetical protein Gohar_013595 [Gossypium harknessii]|uniref:Uncharacterized protein n=1 Tax=Gossypium harknessii TaxID=34285 RepID=A0A7J9H0T1_9ROSI|nr:hypothetical protein [Gossypium harknessii]
MLNCGTFLKELQLLLIRDLTEFLLYHTVKRRYKLFKKLLPGCRILLWLGESSYFWLK